MQLPYAGCSEKLQTAKQSSENNTTKLIIQGSHIRTEMD